MKILILHQYYKLPSQGGGIRSWYLVNKLLQENHEVTVLTIGNSRKVLKKKNLKVVYFKIPYDQKLSYSKRLIAFSKFFVQSLYFGFRNRGFDLVYAISTPLTVGILGKWISRVQRSKFVFEIGDLWPWVPIEMGIIKNPALKKALLKAEKNLYRKADLNVALSPDIKDYILNKAPGSKCIVTTNFADTSVFNPSYLDYTGKSIIKVGYFGSLGEANNYPFIKDVIQKNPEIEFHIAVKGTYSDQLLNEVGKERNVMVLEYSGIEKVADYLSKVHFSLVSFSTYQSLATGSPNKFFDSLASGKPLLINFDGWIADLIHKENIGIKLTDTQLLYNSIKSRYPDELSYRSATKKARIIAQTQFSPEAQLPDWYEAIRNLHA